MDKENLNTMGDHTTLNINRKDSLSSDIFSPLRNDNDIAGFDQEDLKVTLGDKLFGAGPYNKDCSNMTQMSNNSLFSPLREHSINSSPSINGNNASLSHSYGRLSSKSITPKSRLNSPLASNINLRRRYTPPCSRVTNFSPSDSSKIFTPLSSPLLTIGEKETLSIRKSTHVKSGQSETTYECKKMDEISNAKLMEENLVGKMALDDDDDKTIIKESELQHIQIAFPHLFSNENDVLKLNKCLHSEEIATDAEEKRLTKKEVDDKFQAAFHHVVQKEFYEYEMAIKDLKFNQHVLTNFLNAKNDKQLQLIKQLVAENELLTQENERLKQELKKRIDLKTSE